MNLKKKKTITSKSFPIQKNENLSANNLKNSPLKRLMNKHRSRS